MDSIQAMDARREAVIAVAKHALACAARKWDTAEYLDAFRASHKARRTLQSKLANRTADE